IGCELCPVNLTTKILLGILLGLIVGTVLHLYFPGVFDVHNGYIFDPIAELFIKAIKMLDVPLVFFSIAAGAAGIADTRKLGRIGVKTIGLYMLTTAVDRKRLV